MIDLFTDADRKNIGEIQNENISFLDAVHTLGLDPEVDFIGADLRGVDFGISNLNGFNFSYADLRGSKGSPNRVSGALVDNAEIHDSPFESEVFVKALSDKLLPYAKAQNLIFEISKRSSIDVIDFIQECLTYGNKEPWLYLNLLLTIDIEPQSAENFFSVFDDLIVHDYPSVAIAAVKYLEKYISYPNIRERYQDVMLGEEWLHVRRTAYYSLTNPGAGVDFVANEEPNRRWPDPVTLLESEDLALFNFSATNATLAFLSKCYTRRNITYIVSEQVDGYIEIVPDYESPALVNEAEKKYANLFSLPNAFRFAQLHYWERHQYAAEHLSLSKNKLQIKQAIKSRILHSNTP